MSDSKSIALGTTIKLNGSNYLLWSRAFLLFLGSQKKRHHVLSSAPDSTDPKFDAWSADDCSVMTWLLNSMDESITKNVMFLDTTKLMWDSLHEMYSNDKNVSRVFELYKKLFSHTQDGQSVNAYFSILKGIADEILLYHPLSCDAATRAAQWEEFMVAKFLSGLDANLRPVRDNLLASDSIPTLSNALSCVLRVTTGRTESTSSDTSTMVAQGRGRRGGRGGQGGRGADDDKDARFCSHCGRTNHVSEKYWAKFGKPEWETKNKPSVAQADSSSADMVSVSRAEYETLLASSSTPSSTAASTTAGVFAVSHGLADEEDDWWRT